MDLMIGSLNFRVGSLGSIRLSDPMKTDPSASEPETVAMSESSEGFSSEVNSPASLAEAKEGKIAGGDETMENFDLEVQLEDLTIHHSDQSTDSWKTGLELSEDDKSIFSSHNSKFDNRCQILAIAEDNSEELDDNNNPVLNPANINRGANHLAEGETDDSLATRVKVRLSEEEWRTINTRLRHISRVSYLLFNAFDMCLVDLFSYKIPMHRKWFRFKCISYLLFNALSCFKFLYSAFALSSFMTPT
jgi:hypothetical protein